MFQNQNAPNFNNKGQALDDLVIEICEQRAMAALLNTSMTTGSGWPPPETLARGFSTEHLKGNSSNNWDGSFQLALKENFPDSGNCSTLILPKFVW